MSDILPRLLRACATGYGCRSAISPKGMANLTRHKLWHEAADAIIRLDTVHPRSLDCFLDAWMQGSALMRLFLGRSCPLPTSSARRAFMERQRANTS
jgi:hypothetical protein